MVKGDILYLIKFYIRKKSKRWLKVSMVEEMSAIESPFKTFDVIFSCSCGNFLALHKIVEAATMLQNAFNALQQTRLIQDAEKIPPAKSV